MSASINVNGVFDSNSVVIEMYNEYGERELPPQDIVDTYNNWLSQQQ